MSDIARGRIPVANLFQFAQLWYERRFPATFQPNCCQNAVKSRWGADPEQLEALQLPVTPPEKW